MAAMGDAVALPFSQFLKCLVADCRGGGAVRPDKTRYGCRTRIGRALSVGCLHNFSTNSAVMANASAILAVQYWDAALFS